MTWLKEMELRDLRNIHQASVELSPGLNVFLGRNAQGKTSLLEGVGLLARGRSFRTEDGQALIRRGAPHLFARGRVQNERRVTALEVELGPGSRRLRVDAREVPPGAYQGRLEAMVYSTDRLRVIQGPMRERRLFLDRGASLLWPSYRQTLRDYQRVLQQRTAALESRSTDLEAWNERLIEFGGSLRHRRQAYVARLADELRRGFRPAGESYEIAVRPGGEGDEETSRQALRRELEASHVRERGTGRSLVGPQRDRIELTVDGQEAALTASSGQARSLLLALTLAALAVYREVTGHSAVALLDDLDSELDEERARTLCEEVVRGGQALVTTAHGPWAERVGEMGRVFHVSAGGVQAASLSVGERN